MGEGPAEDDLEQPQSPRDGATKGRPKIRPVEPLWIEHEGAEYLYLRDPLGLTGKGVMVPQQMAPLLALCDGTRGFGELQAGLALRTGMRISATQVAEFVAGLDEALLLEGGAYVDASARALATYRESPYREPSHADLVYPADPAGLASELDRLVANVEPLNGPDQPMARSSAWCVRTSTTRGAAVSTPNCSPGARATWRRSSWPWC